MRLNLAALLALVAFTAHDPAGAVLSSKAQESCTNFALASLHASGDRIVAPVRF